MGGMDPDADEALVVGLDRALAVEREEHDYAYPASDGFRSASTIDLFLEVDPTLETVAGCYGVDDGPVVLLEAGLAIAADVTVDPFPPCAYAALVHTNNDWATASPGDDPDNSPWHPVFDRFSVAFADQDHDGLSLCDGDPDERP